MSAPRLRVLVASHFIDDVRAELADAFDAVFEDTREPASALERRAANGETFDALVVSIDTPVREDAIARLPDSTRAIATYSVGTDHIDLAAARERGIAVYNTPGVLADSVAEDAVFLMLAAARRATESIALIRSREWPGWTPTQLVGLQLAGRTLGVLGMGDIGVRIARIARAIGMDVAYCNRSASPFEAELEARRFGSAQELVAESDVLMLVCPSTDETRGILSRELLANAKPDLLVVNVARGEVVDDDALVEALAEHRIAGAALDVFAGEPDVDPRYFDLPNVFMVPHIGSSTREARIGMGRAVIAGLHAIASGGEPAPPGNRVV